MTSGPFSVAASPTPKASAAESSPPFTGPLPADGGVLPAAAPSRTFKSPPCLRGLILAKAQFVGALTQSSCRA